KVPAALVVPEDDDGGPLTNGGNHEGTLQVGDMDAWTTVAAVGQTMNFRVGEVSGGNAFSPYIYLYDPNGALVASDSHTSDARIVFRATVAGTYTAVVSGYYAGDNGTYRLHFQQTGTPYVVPAGDEGGA